MRRFGTQGPVNPQEHYVVSRTEEISDFIERVEEGKYVVLFAPRQTGKTTFFQAALETLAVGNAATAQAESSSKFTYFPVQLNFDVYKNTAVADFYANLYGHSGVKPNALALGYRFPANRVNDVKKR